MKHFTARATFMNNVPQLKEKCLTEEKASATISNWSKTKAGITSLNIFTPEGAKHTFDAAGNYRFTVSAEICQRMKIKP